MNKIIAVKVKYSVINKKTGDETRIHMKLSGDGLMDYINDMNKKE